MDRSSHAAPDQRIAQAREHLTHARRHRVTELPPSALIRELAESRRQLGQLLDAVDQMSTAIGAEAPLVIDQAAALSPEHGETSGPFETERQAAELPAVRAVHEAFAADPGVGKMAPYNLDMLIRACWAAGAEVGAYDRRILTWLAGFEPTTCAVVAGLITRAAAGRDAQ